MPNRVYFVVGRTGHAMPIDLTFGNDLVVSAVETYMAKNRRRSIKENAERLEKYGLYIVNPGGETTRVSDEDLQEALYA